MPNMVDLTVSTPVKDEPEVKEEIVSMTNVPRSLPLENTGSSQGMAANLTIDDISASTEQSVTLGTETRSADTSSTSTSLTTTPPPVASPPAKIRRCTRQSMKDT